MCMYMFINIHKQVYFLWMKFYRTNEAAIGSKFQGKRFLSIFFYKCHLLAFRSTEIQQPYTYIYVLPILNSFGNNTVVAFKHLEISNQRIIQQLCSCIVSWLRFYSPTHSNFLSFLLTMSLNLFAINEKFRVIFVQMNTHTE